MFSRIRYRTLKTQEYLAIGLILLLATFQTLFFAFLTPPWQHYDEPGHFEYAWLIANQPGFPERGAYDQAMRRELVASMVEYGFYKDGAAIPNLLSTGDPIPIGITQVGDVPIYYWIVSLPLRLVRYTDITFQLYLARLVSLVFFLITVIAAYGVARELTPPGHALRWMLPGMVALLPAFVDLMTAVNNDVGAVAFFSLFFWAAVRMVKRGFSVLRLAALVLFAILAWYTKGTGGIAVFVLPIPVLFSLLRGRLRPLAWAAIAVGLSGVVLAALNWGDAAGWTRQSQLSFPSRLTLEQAPLGTHAFRLSLQPGAPEPQLVQWLRDEQNAALRGEPVTLGAWIWASAPIEVNFPILLKDNITITIPVQVGTEPAYFTNSAYIGKNIQKVGLLLSPFTGPVEQPVEVYIDGLVLAQGGYTQGEPQFATDKGTTGFWGDMVFRNMLRNPSAEAAWPRLRGWTENLAHQYLQGNPYLALSALLDYRLAGWYYRATFKNLLNTFWAQFGWGHVTLVAINQLHPYRLMAGITLIGLAGLVLAASRRFRSMQRGQQSPVQMQAIPQAQSPEDGTLQAAFATGVISDPPSERYIETVEREILSGDSSEGLSKLSAVKQANTGPSDMPLSYPSAAVSPGTLPWDLIFLVVISLALSWIPTILRGIQSLQGNIFIPSARYAFPSIIPTALALCTGWLAWAEIAERRLRLPGWFKMAAFFIFFLLLDIAALISIRMFYG